MTPAPTGITNPSYHDRVLAGMDFLDEKVGPDWIDKIDLSHFIITSPCDCVIGQLQFHYDGGGYTDGACRLGLASDDDEVFRRQDEAHALGFFENALEGEENGDVQREYRWLRLEQAWMHAIAKRQKARP